MRNLVFIVFFLSVVFFVIFSLTKDMVTKGIKGVFKRVSVTRFNPSLVNPTVDLKLRFDIQNTTRFSYIIDELFVSIYDNANKEKLGESTVSGMIPINLGNNEVDINVKELKVLKTGSLYFTGAHDLYVVIEFKILTIKVKLEEIVKF